MSYIKKHERCDVCDRYRAVRKDMRFIDGLFDGKIYNCEWCNPLNDVSLYKIATEGRDPKSFYNEEEHESTK
tara:strand:+ start:258 stop:473 length:216 start_codon:yes stop_codon:yes gene_type:complete